jgi:hypothetical protein
MSGDDKQSRVHEALIMSHHNFTGKSKSFLRIAVF